MFRANWGAGNLDGYRYTFNGQEQEKELNPSITSAEFWMYDGRLGRRWNVEPLFKSYPDLSPYVVFKNNPLMYLDVDGREPTLDVVTTIGAVIQVMRTNNIFNLAQAQEYFSEAYVNNDVKRAIYTENRGWIDLKHFFTAADLYIGSDANNLSESDRAKSVLFYGELKEKQQALFKNRSAWSYEDLQSNLQGILFALNFGDLEGEDFLAAVEGFFADILKAANPEDAPNYASIPANKEARVKSGVEGEKNKTYNPLHKKGAERKKVVAKESELERRFELVKTDSSSKKKVVEK
jgi:hypothetical protein